MEQTEELVDITTVYVDPSLSKEERMKEFVRQIKNPNHYLCCGYEVTVSYTDTDLTLEDCIKSIII